MPIRSDRRSESNRILSALSDDEYRRITEKAQVLDIKLGGSLYEPDRPIPAFYFINSGICSVVTTMNDGTSVEVMIVGREGAIGLPALESASATTSTHAFMQIEGSAMKISAALAREEFRRSGKFQLLLLRQLQLTVAQITQTAACNRLHNLEERFSRWLLMVHDRINVDTFNLTHDFLAQMLGTRRSSVTLAAGMLHRAGLIEYRRGQMKILNRKGLEAAACECYPVVRASFNRFLKD
jgi:CRP-like cAMP-binding protein